MQSLFSLVSEYKALQQLDIEEIDERTLLDTLEGLAGTLEIKATNVALYQQNVQAFADMAKDASKKLAERASRIQRKADSIKAYLQGCLEAAQITKVESPELTLSIKKNPPALVISSAESIPEKFMIQPPTPPKAPDKAAIKEAIKAGESVPGCHLEQGQRLEVKV